MPSAGREMTVKTDPTCPNCRGTGVDLGDINGLARFVQACHCVEGGDFDERDLWAIRRVLEWRVATVPQKDPSP